MKQKRELLWITDPWNTLDHPRETTLRLIEESQKMGISQAWCDVKSIRLQAGLIQLDAQSILSVEPSRSSDSFKMTPLQTYLPTDFVSLQYRPDPPVGLPYYYPLQLLVLGLANSKHSEIINPPEVLFSKNEKIESAALRDLMPPSLISSQWEALISFGKSQGRTVMKPLHESQSHGIELLDWRTQDSIEHSREQLTHVTQNFTLPILIQRYLEGIREGEKRFWFVEGKLLAAVKKLPLTGDFRIKIDAGSPVLKTTLSRQEKLKAERIGKYLKKNSIKLAAIDMIEGYVTDFNLTSPGLITQMEKALNENFSRTIISSLVPRLVRCSNQKPQASVKLEN